jgi:AAA+ superfamily predicted ATPase
LASKDKNTELQEFLNSFEALITSLKEERGSRNPVFEKDVKDFLNLADFSKVQTHSKRIAKYALQKTYSYHLYEFIKQERFKIDKHQNYSRYSTGLQEEDWEDFPINIDDLVDIPWGVSFFVTDTKLKINFILTFDFNDTERYLFYHGAADKKKINTLNNDFQTFFKDFNIYKGARVEYSLGLNFIEDTKITFDDVILDPQIMQEIEENILGIFNEPDKYKKNNIPLKRGVIFSGPPGCGKSLTINAIANAVKGKVTFIAITSKSIERPSDLSSIYEFARMLAPTLVVFEDVDLLGGDRSAGEFSPYVGELLAQLDGLTSNEGGIVTIASTNHPERLDKALKDRPSRFDRNLPFNQPDDDLRLIMLMRYLESYTFDPNINFSKIIGELTGFTGAQIKEVVISSALHALNQNKKSKKGKKDTGSIILTQENLLAGINKSKNKFEKKKNPVGF